MTKIIKTNGTGIRINIIYGSKMKTEDIVDTRQEKGEEKGKKENSDLTIVACFYFYKERFRFIHILYNFL